MNSTSIEAYLENLNLLGNASGFFKLIWHCRINSLGSISAVKGTKCAVSTWV